MLLLWLQHARTAEIIGIEIFLVLVFAACILWWRTRRL